MPEAGPFANRVALAFFSIGTTASVPEIAAYMALASHMEMLMPRYVGMHIIIWCLDKGMAVQDWGNPIRKALQAVISSTEMRA